MNRSNFCFQLSGYRLTEELYSDHQTALYRAVPTASALGTPPSVLIKFLPAAAPTHQQRLEFRHQYAISQELNLAGIVRFQQLLESDPLWSQGGYWGAALVLADNGSAVLDGKEQRLALPAILRVAIQLADILHGLGQRRIVHKDLKPAHLLIHPITQQVQLIDLRAASLLPSETASLASPQSWPGTLAYMAPEQTGRMNRGIDYRTDFYALGVTLYELLTGKLPFPADDPLELMHSHLAQLARPVAQVNLAVPVMVSQIVAKLMAKNAEDRYQSAGGLRHDMQECLDQWLQQGAIAEFELGQRDLSSRFLIPEKLYGRETEVQTLLAALDRVGQGSVELLLVAGWSGIGKTAVINEIHKPIARQHSYFIKGKFDQFNRNLPLSAFIQAWRDLIRQLLTESDSQLALWKSQILAAVGANGQVLLAIIPELERIIGPQPAVTELAGTAAQNRFNLTFQKFMAVFTTAAHPLVVFLDDLQWADLASLQFIKLLMAGGGHLLLLGAYRDHEVSAVHPLMLMVAELNQAARTIQTITLTPLTNHDIDRLVADTLLCSIDRAAPLTELIIRKTQGNPFFTVQFLKSLQAAGDISFNPDGYWECDLGRVQARSIADDVVAFLADQLRKLPITTQEILKLATCIGNQFDLETLAIVAEESSSSVETALWPLLQAGLILTNSPVYKFWSAAAMAPTPSIINININSTYRFLHDRVQQAAYSLIPEHQKQQTHLQIGRLLLDYFPDQQQEEKLFEIVNHFNTAIAMINQPIELELLARLNWRAAQKARTANAYTVAYDYSRIGIEILGAAGWTQQYQLTLALHNILADAALLTGEFALVPQIFQVVLEQAQQPIDRVISYETMIRFHVRQKHYSQSIALGLEILKQLGIKLSPQSDRRKLFREFTLTKIALWGKSNKQLLNLPEIVALEKIAPLRILDLLQVPAFFCSQELMAELSLVGLRLTLRDGNTPWAAGFYATYCIVIAGLGDLQQAYRFSQLATLLADRFADLSVTTRVQMVAAWYANPWHEPLSNIIPLLDKSVVTAIEGSNLQYIGINAGASIYTRFLAGIPLTEIIDRIPETTKLIVQSNDENNQQFFEMVRQTICNLYASSTEPTEILKGQDRLSLIAQWQDRNEAMILSTMYSLQTLLAYYFEDIDQALIYANAQLPYEYTINGNYIATQIWLLDALTRLAAYAQSDQRTQKLLLDRVKQTQRQLGKRARSMPANFQHQYDLVEAEKCRVLGNYLLAMELYDRSIAGAKKSGFLQEEALANELTAKFYLAWGKEKIAATYLQEAYHCYLRWGAMAKTNDLEQRYPQLLTPILQPGLSNLNSLSTLAQMTQATTIEIAVQPRVNSFDLVAVLQSVQALSSIIELPDLINQFCQILLQNSGATTCIPILRHLHQTTDLDLWQVYTIDTTSFASTASQIDPVLKLNCSPLAEYHALPLQLINRVLQDQQTIILEGLASDDVSSSPVPNSLRSTDPYLQHYQPPSVMCLPLLLRGELRGIVYLENCHTADVFTPDRQIVLDFLAAQVVSTLYNAQLYESVALRSAALATSVDGIAIVEKDQFLDLNHSKAHMYGYTVAELLPKSWRCLYAPDQLAYFQTQVFPILSQHGQWRGEVIATRKDGSTFDEEVTLSLLANGQIICISRDITDRKQAAITVRHSEERYHKLFDNIPGVIYQFRIDPAGQITYPYISSGCWNLFQLTPAAVIADSQCAIDLLHPDDLENFQRVIAESAQQMTTKFWEGRAVLKSGEIKWIKSVSRPERQADGAIIWDGMMIDVTDRKQAEDQLHQTNQQLELTNQELQRATQLKDEFLATMSHELRTPLNAILGMSEALQEELFGTLNDQQLNSITAIEQSGEHLLSLINDVLDVSKISAGKLELNITQVTLSELCQKSLIFIQKQARDKQIQINTHWPDDLFHIWVDERRIRQVLINLLNNAVKFTHQGGSITLAVQYDPASQGLCFAVSDTGIGISRDDLSKLFQPFVQLDSSLNRQYNGTGLGLLLVKQIVELHSGSVTIESEVGQGSCFRVMLPQVLHHPTAAITLPSGELPVGLARRQMRTILLAEDNEVNINTFASYLTAKGYQMMIAYSGEEAIELATSFCPDLILMDIQMPGMDGLAVIQHLRQQLQSAHIPIVALTALVATGEREKCLAAGADQYLTKPVKLKELHHTIQEYLGVK